MARSIGGYVHATKKNFCLWYDIDTPNYEIDSNSCIRFETLGNEAQFAIIKEVTTTDFTISWTEYLTPSSEDTVTIAFLV